MWDPFALVFIGWAHVRIENRGSTDVYNVTATVMAQPANKTFLNAVVTVGDIAGGSSA